MGMGLMQHTTLKFEVPIGVAYCLFRLGIEIEARNPNVEGGLITEFVFPIGMR